MDCSSSITYEDNLFTVRNTKAGCPHCDVVSNEIKGPANVLHLIDFPVDLNRTRLRLKVRKFVCNNSECTHYRRSFRDPLNGYLPVTGRLPVSVRFLDFICVLYTVMPLKMVYLVANGLFCSSYADHVFFFEEVPSVIKENRILEIVKTHPQNYPLFTSDSGNKTNILAKDPEAPLFKSKVLKNYAHYLTYINQFLICFRDWGDIEEYKYIFRNRLSDRHIQQLRMDFCSEVKKELFRIKALTDVGIREKELLEAYERQSHDL